MGRGRFSLIPPAALLALAKRYEDGATHYGANNWMKGMPRSRLFARMMRPLLAASQGDESEDHLAAILWNASAWMWTEQASKDGRLPDDLNDLPYN